MINKIKNSFSIQDLEILSGIKAHTIRIWEKRYGMFNPTRLNRNIRVYSLYDLQKILNVSLLLSYNYKISELSKLADVELARKSKLISEKKLPGNYYINTLIVSMFTLDDALFEEVYVSQTKILSFKEMFIGTYVPLLDHIGVLWQTNGVNPAQEHFITNLIYQKIALNIATVPKVKSDGKPVNILFLPEGEIHEIGLYFLTYCLKLSGERTIYLGRDIPAEDLDSINSQFQHIHWICAFTIIKTDEEKEAFVAMMKALLLHSRNTCSVIGNIWKNYTTPDRPDSLMFYERFDQFITI